MEPINILIIDDERVICNGCRLALSDESHLVDICMTGKAGLDAILKGQYDVVLLDLKLPDLGGMEILNTVRKEKPGVYIATLRIMDEKGREDIDFYKVKVFTESAPESRVPTIFMTYTPTNNIFVNQSVLFRFWLQGVRGESIEVDFGDGTVIKDYVSYSELRHKFTSPGIHVVTASGTIDGKSITQKQKVLVSEDKP